MLTSGPGASRGSTEEDRPRSPSRSACGVYRPPSPRGEVRFDDRAERALFKPASPAEALRDAGGRALGDRGRPPSPRHADGEAAASDGDRGHRGDQSKGKKGKSKGGGKKGKDKAGKGGGARLVSNPFHFWSMRQQKRQGRGGDGARR